MTEDDDRSAWTDLRGTPGGPTPSGMEDLRIPELYLPFPPKDPNPALERARTTMDAWLTEYGLCRSAASQRSLRRTQVPLITALTYPDAAPRTLELLTQWATWTFIIDDDFDDGPDGEDPQRCAAALGTLLPILDGARPGSGASARAFADTLEHLTSGRSPGWCRMLRDDIRAYLWSYYEGLLDRLTGRTPTLAAYRHRRAVSVAAYTWLDLTEIAAGIDLPDTVRHLSSFRDLRTAAAEYVGLHNDLWSLDRDRAAGGFHNAVLLLQQQEHSTSQEAVDQVNALLSACVHRMTTAETELAAHLRAAGATDRTRADARTCADGYRAFVRGCADYHHQVDRYTRPDPDQSDDTPTHGIFQPGAHRIDHPGTRVRWTKAVPRGID
ncbi:terpene synthase family protein [Streptomyces sp. DSM 40750]|uniref:terpene synthase family protein n=1 Tax=Streptomyces sp. DSM 40750 TaxID=2801030 RepID=UPI00214AF638|nr:terpene synthase family protein [Streptomyces sp. DSM 40750]UUU25730.1 terpene synthase family protein [Streptomyces sp. DSM 40750]